LAGFVTGCAAVRAEVRRPLGRSVPRPHYQGLQLPAVPTRDTGRTPARFHVAFITL